MINPKISKNPKKEGKVFLTAGEKNKILNQELIESLKKSSKVVVALNSKFLADKLNKPVVAYSLDTINSIDVKDVFSTISNILWECYKLIFNNNLKAYVKKDLVIEYLIKQKNLYVEKEHPKVVENLDVLINKLNTEKSNVINIRYLFNIASFISPDFLKSFTGTSITKQDLEDLVKEIKKSNNKRDKALIDAFSSKYGAEVVAQVAQAGNVDDNNDEHMIAEAERQRQGLLVELNDIRNPDDDIVLHIANEEFERNFGINDEEGGAVGAVAGVDVEDIVKDADEFVSETPLEVDKEIKSLFDNINERRGIIKDTSISFMLKLISQIMVLEKKASLIVKNGGKMYFKYSIENALTNELYKEYNIRNAKNKPFSRARVALDKANIFRVLQRLKMDTDNLKNFTMSIHDIKKNFNDLALVEKSMEEVRHKNKRYVRKPINIGNVAGNGIIEPFYDNTINTEYGNSYNLYTAMPYQSNMSGVPPVNIQPIQPDATLPRPMYLDDLLRRMKDKIINSKSFGGTLSDNDFINILLGLTKADNRTDITPVEYASIIKRYKELINVDRSDKILTVDENIILNNTNVENSYIKVLNFIEFSYNNMGLKIYRSGENVKWKVVAGDMNNIYNIPKVASERWRDMFEKDIGKTQFSYNADGSKVDTTIKKRFNIDTLPLNQNITFENALNEVQQKYKSHIMDDYNQSSINSLLDGMESDGINFKGSNVGAVINDIYFKYLRGIVEYTSDIYNVNIGNANLVDGRKFSSFGVNIIGDNKEAFKNSIQQKINSSLSTNTKIGYYNDIIQQVADIAKKAYLSKIPFDNLDLNNNTKYTAMTDAQKSKIRKFYNDLVKQYLFEGYTANTQQTLQDITDWFNNTENTDTASFTNNEPNIEDAKNKDIDNIRKQRAVSGSGYRKTGGALIYTTELEMIDRMKNIINSIKMGNDNVEMRNELIKILDRLKITKRINNNEYNLIYRKYGFQL